MTTGRDLATQSILRRDHDTRQIFTFTVFSAFCRQYRDLKKGEEYDRQWKLRTLFDKLNEAYAKFYNPSEHLAVDEVIVKFKGRVIFRQYIPKKRKRFGVKISNSAMNQGIRMT